MRDGDGWASGLAGGGGGGVATLLPTVGTAASAGALGPAGATSTPVEARFHVHADSPRPRYGRLHQNGWSARIQRRRMPTVERVSRCWTERSDACR